MFLLPPQCTFTLSRWLSFDRYDHYHRIRQEWLASDTHATLARSRTVVIVNIPEAYLAGDKIRDMISLTSAGFAIQRIWLARCVSCPGAGLTLQSYR